MSEDVFTLVCFVLATLGSVYLAIFYTQKRNNSEQITVDKYRLAYFSIMAIFIFMQNLYLRVFNYVCESNDTGNLLCSESGDSTWQHWIIILLVISLAWFLSARLTLWSKDYKKKSEIKSVDSMVEAEEIQYRQLHEAGALDDMELDSYIFTLIEYRERRYDEINLKYDCNA